MPLNTWRALIALRGHFLARFNKLNFRELHATRTGSRCAGRLTASTSNRNYVDWATLTNAAILNNLLHFPITKGIQQISEYPPYGSLDAGTVVSKNNVDFAY